MGLTKAEVLGLVLVVIPAFAIGVYAIVHGAYGEAVDPVSTVLGIVCVVGVVGAIHTWLRNRPRR
jgi:hypothetical protein